MRVSTKILLFTATVQGMGAHTKRVRGEKREQAGANEFFISFFFASHFYTHRTFYNFGSTLNI